MSTSPQRLPRFNRALVAPVKTGYEDLIIQPMDSRFKNYQPPQVQEPGWGDVVGAFGSQLLNSLASRKDSDEEEEKPPTNEYAAPSAIAALRNARRKNVLPWLGNQRNEFAGSFAHGGFVTPEMVGKRVRYAEKEPELVLTEDGRSQWLTEPGEGIVKEPAAIIPLSKVRQFYEQAGVALPDGAPGAPSSGEPLPRFNAQQNLPRFNTQAGDDGVAQTALQPHERAKLDAVIGAGQQQSGERLPVLNLRKDSPVASIPVTDTLPPPVVGFKTPEDGYENATRPTETPQMSHAPARLPVFRSQAGTPTASVSSPASQPDAALAVARFLDNAGEKIARADDQLERDRAELDPAEFARMYPGDGKTLTHGAVAAKAAELGLSPQRVAVDAIKQGYDIFDNEPLEMFAGQPQTNEFSAPGVANRAAQQSSQPTVAPDSVHQVPAVYGGVSDGTVSEVAPAPSREDGGNLYPEDDKYMVNAAARVGPGGPTRADLADGYLSPEDDQYMTRRRARTDYPDYPPVSENWRGEVRAANVSPASSSGLAAVASSAAQPTGAPGSLPPRPNVEKGERPVFRNTGDHLKDLQDFAAQYETYKPQNHNSRAKSIGLAVLYNVVNALSSGQGLAGAIIPAIAGAIHAAVDPSIDEQHAKDRTMARTDAQIKREIGRRLEMAGLQKAEADALLKTQEAADYPDKLRREERAKREAALAKDRAEFDDIVKKYFPKGLPANVDPALVSRAKELGYPLDLIPDKPPPPPPPPLGSPQNRPFAITPGQAVLVPDGQGGMKAVPVSDVDGKPLQPMTDYQQQQLILEKQRIAQFAGRGRRRGSGGGSSAVGGLDKYEQGRLDKAENEAAQSRAFAASARSKAQQARERGEDPSKHEAEARASEDAARVADATANRLRAKQGARRSSDRPATPKAGDPLGILN